MTVITTVWIMQNKLTGQRTTVRDRAQRDALLDMGTHKLVSRGFDKQTR